MRDITFAHRSHKNELYKTPKADIKWWYVIEDEPSIDDDGVEYEGNPEGVSVSIHGQNRDWELIISAGTLVEMLRTVTERITNDESNIAVELRAE